MAERIETGEPVWLEWCPSCERRHYVSPQLCPECHVYSTPQPVYVGVANSCGADYACDGCMAYRDHLR